MLRAPTESLPQRLIITVFGDYRPVLPTDVSSRLLVALLQEFDVGVEAARSALARLVHRRILVRSKSGRETSYGLSDEGERLVEDDRRRIMEFGLPRPWDGQWTMVLFSVAEDKRDRRHAIKTRLRSLGFAPLYDGAWIAAYATVVEAQAAVDDAGVRTADIFHGTLIGLPSRTASLQERWGVEELADDYRSFIGIFAPLAERAASLQPAQAFVARTRMMDMWRAFPQREPDLPADLLPSGWPLPRARRVFTEGFEALRPAAEAHVAKLFG